MTEFARFQAAVDTLLALSPAEQAAYLRDRFELADDDGESAGLLLAWALPPRNTGTHR
jgi:hypothetical protein